jgi:riboflavin kinase/FMN adenylyltransferase
MLEIINYGEGEYDFPCLLVLGCFDGLHIGHAELLKKAKLQAKINGLDLGVMLFADGKGGKQLCSFDERVALLEQYNVKFVLKVNFDDEFKKIKPLDFLACLEEKLNLKAYMSGKDFRFGNGKKGKASTLKSYADDEENSVWYMSVKDVTYGDEKVSTTRIKELLEKGEVKLAADLLGRNYSVSGTVIHGADRGGKIIGYPTLNVRYGEDKYPVKHGVYKVKCAVGGVEYFGIANYGARPTFDENDPVLEVYLDNFSGEHYDETVTVEFLDYIRDIQKFENAEALAAQLSEDILCVTDGASAELAVANADEQTPAQPSGQSVDDDFETELSETVEEVSETQTELAEEPVANETEQPAETETETEQPTTTETEEQVETVTEETETEDNSDIPTVQAILEEVSETQTELAKEPVANETEQPAETETEIEQPTTTETEEQPEIQPESGENND